MVRFDPRLKIAAYCWPDVLIALRRGMGNNEYELGWRIVDALRVADVAFIDDLGAENLTVGGESWRTEQLYAILNKRYNEKAATILTSNVGSSELGDLASYLGPRIFSRICEWLTLVKMDEKDRRME
jgi:DNA replication protein DnaC